MQEVYFTRRDGQDFDVMKVSAWVSCLPGGFHRTNSPLDEVSIIVDDAQAREKWIPLYAKNPYSGHGARVQISKREVSLWLCPSESIDAQIKTFVLRLMSEYDCIVSDGCADITADVKANVNILF